MAREDASGAIPQPLHTPSIPSLPQQILVVRAVRYVLPSVPSCSKFPSSPAPSVGLRVLLRYDISSYLPLLPIPQFSVPLCAPRLPLRASNRRNISSPPKNRV